MLTYRRMLRLGAGLLAFALLLRLGPGLSLLKNERLYSFLMYLETGRIVRFSPSLEETEKFAGESAAPSLLPDRPTFLPADADGIRLWNTSGREPDLQALVTQHLDWNLRRQEPTVLILHTHTTESYTRAGESYQETSAYRTLDAGYNMLSIGDRVARLLEAAGIGVIHDTALHDYPSYNGSYAHARGSIAEYLAQYPSIRLVLDLHRDASGDPAQQLRTLATVDGQPCAQLMLVMGTDASQSHPHWQENLALALKLQLRLEAEAPGITRPIVLRSGRFNQDLLPGALLIEVGAAGNTHAEAMLAAEYLARAIIALSRGSQ